MDIKTLITNVRVLLHESNGLTHLSIKRHYEPAFRFALEHSVNSKHAENIDDTFLDDCLQRVLELYSIGKVSETQLRKYRKSIFVMKQYVNTGTIFHEHLPSLSFRIPIDENEKIRKRYIDLERLRLAESTVKQKGNIIRQFLLYLEDNDYQNLPELTNSIIIEFMEYMSNRRPGGLITVVPTIRSFVDYLFKIKITPLDLSNAANVHITRKYKIKGVFTLAEINQIFEQIDTTTSIGKRDFAIMMLAYKNGLRSSDILNMKLMDILWNSAEFAIIQKKTLTPLICPMDTNTGNAIADYILNARSLSTFPNIFLSVNHSRPITSAALCCILKKYMQNADVKKSSDKRFGMHTFRRTLGTSLLENDVPLETISQILGHKNSVSTKQYLSISEKKLAECSLRMPSITSLIGGKLDD